MLERRGMSVRSLPNDDEMPVALASITASELITGIYRADTPERRIPREAFVERLLATIPILPFDLPEARLYAQLTEALRARGLSIGAHGSLIAATALASGYERLTDTLRHFEQIEGLNVRRPLP